MPGNLEAISDLSRTVCVGLGQTNVVADGNNVVRKAESNVQNNRALKPLRMWDTLNSKQVMATHRRAEVDPKPGTPDLPTDVPKVSESFFSTKDHDVVLHGLSICHRKTRRHVLWHCSRICVCLSLLYSSHASANADNSIIISYKLSSPI